MLQTLQKTVDFETQLARKFGATATGQYTRAGKGLDEPDKEGEDGATVEGDNEDDDDIIERDPHSAEAIKAKYRKHMREKKRAEAAKATDAQVKVETIPAAKYMGSISGCFEPYLSYYIDAESTYERQRSSRDGPFNNHDVVCFFMQEHGRIAGQVPPGARARGRPSDAGLLLVDGSLFLLQKVAPKLPKTLGAQAARRSVTALCDVSYFLRRIPDVQAASVHFLFVAISI